MAGNRFGKAGCSRPPSKKFRARQKPLRLAATQELNLQAGYHPPEPSSDCHHGRMHEACLDGCAEPAVVVGGAAPWARNDRVIVRIGC
jgi:hypothetical protein